MKTVSKLSIGNRLFCGVELTWELMGHFQVAEQLLVIQEGFLSLVLVR